MNTDIRYSKQDAAETGHGWYAVRRDRDHKLPDVSHLFRTREEAEAWARRKGDVIRKASKPIADCPQAESPLRPIVYVPQLRFLPGMPSNDDHPTPPAMAGRANA